MKKTFLTAAFSFIAIIGIAQKKEIREAEKAIEDNKFTEAKSNITQAEALIKDAKESVLEDFYYTKAMAYLGAETNNNLQDLITASEAMKKAVALGHKDAERGLEIIKNRLVGSAIDDQNADNFKMAAEKLITSYNLDNRDTLYLFYAAANFMNAKEFPKALEHFITLKELGYTGIETQYVATNKSTGEVESYSKEDRDALVKVGSHINPEDQQSTSKTGEIAKYIALIYIQNGETEKAIEAMEVAKKENPDDMNLLHVEAEIYNNLGDMQKYKAIMEQIVQRDPNNPILFYNLGISSANLEDYEAAVDYYERALELDPSMVNAQINIAAIILQDEQKINDQMNNLGMSAADNKKYEELEKSKKAIYNKALPYLKAAYETNPENLEVIRTLMNIYYQVGQSDKAKEMRDKLAELEAK
ncbi:MAG TPA: tetratricopeptide repeat protein [Salinimicrobium sp.]|nr:tetratricopeptide repeat protein [Salinimicrobium sp.]